MTIALSTGRPGGHRRPWHCGPLPAVSPCSSCSRASPKPVRSPQKAFTWQEIHDKFEAANPTLQAFRIGIAESRANETTAYLKPNPQITANLDQINPFSTQPSPNGTGTSTYNPFAYTLPYGSMSYLHERQNKRELRRDSTQQATGIAPVDSIRSRPESDIHTAQCVRSNTARQGGAANWLATIWLTTTSFWP